MKRFFTEDFVTDLHSHTFFSHDGRESTENYVLHAIEKGDKRIGFSEHYDYDCYLCGNDTPLCDIDKYYAEIKRLREKYSGKIEILFGIEFGYSDEAVGKYKELSEKYPFDYIINNVHLTGGRDYAEKRAYTSDNKKSVYGKYLEDVKRSVNADYDWQIAAHIGYPSRYAPYEDRTLYYDDYKEIIDEILKTIIERGKYLEINASTKCSAISVPDEGIVKRYAELGGKCVTYGSDEHDLRRYREKVAEIKKIADRYGLTLGYIKNV